MYNKKIFVLFSLFMVLLCCFSAVSASENATDDIVAVSDDVAMDEVVSEVDSDDKSISVQENEEIESSDDANNESLEVSDVEEVDDVDDSSSVLSAEENDNEVSGQTPNNTFINCHQAATGTNNRFINCTPSSVNNVNSIIKANTELLGAVDNEILKESRTINDIEEWRMMFRQSANNDIIYIKSGKYFDNGDYAPHIPEESGLILTIIGLNRDEVIISDFQSIDTKDSFYTFVNITFNGNMKLKGSKTFINCTFNNSSLDIGRTDYDAALTFENCIFKDYTSESAFISAYNYKVNMSGCTFEDISADSIVSSDNVAVSNSQFNNVNVNGVIDTDNVNIAIFENNNPENIAAFRPAVEDSIITIEIVNRTHLKVTLKDAEGNPVSGAKISLTTSIDASFIAYLESNDKGIAFYETGDMTGNHFTWAATCEAMKSRSVSYGYAFNETYVDYRELAKEVVISLENVTGDKNGNVTVTLKNKLNEVVANANVTYKINGKEFKAITDENGTFLISNLTGDNEIYVEYAGSDNLAYANATQKFTFPKEEVKPTPSNTTKPSTPTKTNTPTKVTKKATKITAKKKTFKAKKKTKKYSIVLKAGKKAVKKVKVTLKVGKKTYKATTNSKGKATFKITKLNKKGKYTAVIKFKGNKNFKATSKKVKITVKK